MKLIWTSEARDNLREIVSYIWADNPSAAQEMKTRIMRLTAYIGHQPFMGRPGAVPGTREAIPHPSYRLIYQIGEETVSILAIVHTSRQWPPLGPPMDDD